jgi:hypothetical protein
MRFFFWTVYKANELPLKYKYDSHPILGLKQMWQRFPFLIHDFVSTNIQFWHHFCHYWCCYSGVINKHIYVQKTIQLYCNALRISLLMPRLLVHTTSLRELVIIFILRLWVRAPVGSNERPWSWYLPVLHKARSIPK